jgi:large subunit ribosomal protein L17
VEPIITRAKSGTLNDIREVAKYIDDRDMIKKIFTEIAPLYKNRKGGYTRVLRIGNRPGDNAETALIELIDASSVFKKEEPKKDEKAKKDGEPKELKEAKKEKPKKEEKEAKKTDKKVEVKKDKKEEKKDDRKKTAK